MADKTITLRIPDAKVALALQGFLATYPNSETIDDPDWVEPEGGGDVDQLPKYTNGEWVNERIRRGVIRDVRRGLQKIAIEAAQIADDDSIIENV